MGQYEQIQGTINSAWEKISEVNASTRGEIREAVTEALDGLDRGVLRVAEKVDGKWHVHQWLKKAVLISFRRKCPSP